MGMLMISVSWIQLVVIVLFSVLIHPFAFAGGCLPFLSSEVFLSEKTLKPTPFTYPPTFTGSREGNLDRYYETINIGADLGYSAILDKFNMDISLSGHEIHRLFTEILQIGDELFIIQRNGVHQINQLVSRNTVA
jgi:hypothetical protein